MIFVNSMSDLFHKDVDRAYIDQVFDTMERADWHVFQVLTKRSSLMRNYVEGALRRRAGTPAHLAWCLGRGRRACQPHRPPEMCELRGPLHFLRTPTRANRRGRPHGIAWAIVGGESGPGARPMRPEWARLLRDTCERDGVAFFFKQWGGARPKSGGRLLDGEEWNGFPTKIVPRPILQALTG